MNLHADHFCKICDTLCAFCDSCGETGAHCMNGHDHPGYWEGRAPDSDPRQSRFNALVRPYEI